MAPDHPALAHLVQGHMAEIWHRINHRDLSAIYPPLVMLWFRFAAAIAPSTAVFKAAIAVFDLLALGVLVRIVQRGKTPVAHLFWYALNPLVLVYVAGEAHLDIIQAALLVSGLYALGSRRLVTGFLALGAAAVTKYFSAAAIPFALQRSNRRAWLAAAAAGLAFLPFVQAPRSLFESLVHFGARMHYNDGLAEALRFSVGSAALPVLAVLLGLILAGIYLLEHDTYRSVFLAMGAVLICLPTLHPWYLLIMAPFMVSYPSRAWLYLMMAAALATLPVQAHELETGVFKEIKWLKWFEYGPFFALLLADYLTRRTAKAAWSATDPQTVTVVMPVLNEANGIQAAVQAAWRQPGVMQVIVVDGGSQDATRTLAAQAGAAVFSGPRGRGTQAAIGAARARGEVILILHADARLVPGAVARMLQALSAAPAIAGGALGMSFTSPSRKLKWVARLNNWRARWSGIAFGDQGQFVRRSALEAMGGFPAVRLMEDVELALRMKSFGRPLLVPRGIRVSPRRWENRPFTRNAWGVIALFLRYLLERRFNGPDRIQTDYYQKYYGH
jgi:rSAM/selenodomain-associated transferase 2